MFNETMDVYIDTSVMENVLKDSCCKYCYNCIIITTISFTFLKTSPSMEAGVSGATGLTAVKDAWPPDPEFVTTLLLSTGG